jgi:hypothetical protein
VSALETSLTLMLAALAMAKILGNQ